MSRQFRNPLIPPPLSPESSTTGIRSPSLISCIIYYISDHFRVFKFSRISDFDISHEVKNTRNFIFLWYYKNNFRKILEFANVSFLRNSSELKPLEYYQIYSMAISPSNSIVGPTILNKTHVACSM